MGKTVTLTFTWRKVSQWLSKSIIPVGLGVVSIALAFVLSKPELLGGAAAFATPILELLQKRAKDAMKAEEASGDKETAEISQVVSDVATDVENDISKEAKAMYKVQSSPSEISLTGTEG